MPNEESLVLCYLTCPPHNNEFYGAILLTDYRVRPLHFAFVKPIRPTTIQQVLYGSTLKEHVRVDVIAQKLWSGIPSKPHVIFVDDHDLLPIARIAKIPTAHLKASESSTNGEALSRFSYDTGSDSAAQEVVGPIIATLEATCDLIEPFARLKQALREAMKSND